MNIRHLNGSSIRIRKALGTAPINGPKYGIIFVMPIITETSSENGIPHIVVTINVMQQTINESLSVQVMN